jgi:hypothetical protein
VTLDEIMGLSRAADLATAEAATAKKVVVQVTKRAARKEEEAAAARQKLAEAKAAFEKTTKK